MAGELIRARWEGRSWLHAIRATVRSSAGRTHARKDDGVRLLSAPVDGTPYLPATPQQVAASVGALRVLAARVTVFSPAPGTRPLYVRLAHFDHGAFLSIELHGMNALPYTGRIREPEDHAPLRSPAVSVLVDPWSATADEPFTYVLTVNDPVAVQVEAALGGLAALLARQELVDRGYDNIGSIDAEATLADARAERDLHDAIRARGWSEGADTLRERSVAAGRPFLVEYGTTVFDEEQLRRRAPILRHVYNVVPEARAAVDRTAAALSQTMESVGGGTQEMGAYVRQLLDVGASRTYLAHVARDAFVCGNGYLSFGSVPDEDMRLLLPDRTRMIGPERAVVIENDKEVVHDPVLHLRGAQQVEGRYGLSVLEPFVMVAMRRQIFEQTLALEAQVKQAASAEEVARMDLSAQLARRVLAEDATTASRLLGGVNALPVEVPADLYFPGHALMQPAVEAIGLSFPEGV